MSKKKVLIISFTKLATEPRAIRQAQSIETDFEIITAGYNSFTFGNFEHYKIPNYTLFKQITFHHSLPSILRKFFSIFILLKNKISQFIISYFPSLYSKLLPYNFYNNQVFKQLKHLKIDAIIANDINTLALSYRLSKLKNIPIIFDAHEYAPGEFDSNAKWEKEIKPSVIEICKTYLPKVNLMFTVCEGIAQEYKKVFGINSVVITNATDYSDLKPSITNTNKIKLIHHGAAIAERHLELMIEMMPYLDERFELYLMLIPNDKTYYENLKEKSKIYPCIYFIDAVKTSEIAKRINEFDIGIVFVPPVCLNYKFGLGNKFFEFVQARLMLGLGPLQEMVKISEQYNLGVNSTDFNPESLAKLLNTLDTETIMNYKNNAHQAALELNSIANKKIMHSLISELLQN